MVTMYMNWDEVLYIYSLLMKYFVIEISIKKVTSVAIIPNPEYLINFWYYRCG